MGDVAVIGVVGNKSDLFMKQEVDEQLGLEYAKKHGGIFQLISAKANKSGLDKYMTKIVTEYITRNPNVLTNEDSIHLFKHNENNEEIKAGCCAGEKSKRMIKKYGDIVKENKGIINIVFLGQKSSGKTSIINRILKKDFNIKEMHT